jgi:hypothetical protein
MFIQVRAENSPFGNQDWQSEVEAFVQSTLGRFGERITSVEVLLSNGEGGERGGGSDKRCLIKARVNGLKPVAIRTHAPFYDVAIADCAEKMERTLDRRLSRVADNDGRVSPSEMN